MSPFLLFYFSSATPVNVSIFERNLSAQHTKIRIRTALECATMHEKLKNFSQNSRLNFSFGKVGFACVSIGKIKKFENCTKKANSHLSNTSRPRDARKTEKCQSKWGFAPFAPRSFSNISHSIHTRCLRLIRFSK